MSVSDPVADFLTCVRNAIRAKHRKVDVPASKLKTELARVLLRERYINNFKVIENDQQGTLRGARMFEFYDRMGNVAVPRIRDFRGLKPRSFDGHGNYSLGLQEQTIFPEINIEKVGKIRGLDVTIVTTARTDEEGRELLRLMNMPFRPQ